MANTPHLDLTLLEQSQAQKEVTVNEAFVRIDALLNKGVISAALATPPASPQVGDLYIVAGNAQAEWAGKEDHIAFFSQVWQFIAPGEGALFWDSNTGALIVYHNSQWQAAS